MATDTLSPVSTVLDFDNPGFGYDACFGFCSVSTPKWSHCGSICAALIID